MTITDRNIKYSIFGKYDFMDANSSNVSTLYGIFGKDKFLPNMIQMFQVEQPTNNITKIMRPQFINEDMKCTITFLPDRIDIEIKAEGDICIDTIIGYYSEIIEKFQLKINRIALNASMIIDVSTPEKTEAIRKGIINENSYPYNEEVIEWGTRNVSRKECVDLGELVNVGQIIQSMGFVTGNGNCVKQIQIDTDINTLAENSDDRFDALSCKLFFAQANIWNKEIFDNFERIA